MYRMSLPEIGISAIEFPDKTNIYLNMKFDWNSVADLSEGRREMCPPHPARSLPVLVGLITSVICMRR